MCANCALRPTILPIRPALRPANFRSGPPASSITRLAEEAAFALLPRIRRLSRPVPDVDGGRYAVAVAVCGADGRFPRRAARLRVGRFRRRSGPQGCRGRRNRAAGRCRLPKVALFLPHPLLPSLPGPAPQRPPPRKAVFPRPQPLPPPAPCALPPLHSLSHRGRWRCSRPSGPETGRAGRRCSAKPALWAGSVPKTTSTRSWPGGWKFSDVRRVRAVRSCRKPP